MVSPSQYVPPHLQGQIGNIQHEQDGSMSFDNPDGQVGLNPESSRVHIGPEEARATFDRNWRASNQSEAVANQYQPPHMVMFNERLQRGAGGWLKNNIDNITGTPGRNIAASGLLGALAGGAGGAYMASRDGSSMVDKSLLYSILGGLGGAGLSALSQHIGNNSLADAGVPFTKAASVDGALMCDNNLTSAQRMALSEAASRLPYHERNQLESMISTIVGGGAGLLIAQFLGMRGLISPLIMAAIGAMVGNGMQQAAPIYNAMGQLTTDNYR